MHNLLEILRQVIGVAIAIAAVGLMIYLKYRQARSYSDRKDEKADIQTLFDGKK
jgi:nitrogen fixation-related uncharacterized protein